MIDIYNIKLKSGIEILSEVLPVTELPEEMRKPNSIVLSHPVVINSHPIYLEGDEVFEIKYSYQPLLNFSKHAGYALSESDILIIDSIDPKQAEMYVSIVIEIYGHLYEDESEDDQDIDSPTLH